MTILEAGEAPRWRFQYDNFNNDPAPDILLLGSYKHPRTGNNLVGGINLHYLNKEQVDALATALPSIMSGGNLYGRYHQGLRVLPDIFDNYYRTYNAAFIRGVRQDVMYPKLGFMAAASDWLKKKFGGLFKSKAQREKEAEPVYPDDLKTMQQKLEQVVTQLQAEPVEPEVEVEPEISAAQDEFLKAQHEQDKPSAEVERDEDIQLNRASKDVTDAEPAAKPSVNVAPTTRTNVKTPETTLPAAATVPPVAEPMPKVVPQTVSRKPVPPAAGKPPAITTRPSQVPTEPAVPPPDATKGPPAAPSVKPSTPPAEPAEPEPEVPELNELADLEDLEESIVYYSPIQGRYIIEPAYKIVHSNW